MVESRRRSGRLDYHYGPDVLQLAGPLIHGVWSVPSYIQGALRAEGDPVPAAVRGLLLVDTGAAVTCISIDTAQRLRLRPTRLATGYGAGGEHTNPVFFAALAISSHLPSESSLTWQGEVQGVPDLEKHSEELNLEVDGAPASITGLLGRDLLRAVSFQYDGRIGSLHMSFAAEI